MAAQKKWFHKDDIEIQIDADKLDTVPDGFIPGRKNSIGTAMSVNRKSGKVKTWNTGIPASETQKTKQSIAMSGREPWNKGLSKETNASVASAAKKLLGHKCFVADWPAAKQKEYITKKLNKSFNTSLPEKNMLADLQELYGIDDVIYQYSADKRYPFNCDFYIKSQDLFIELNLTWEHGEHPFNEDSREDFEKLSKWQLKAGDMGPNNRYLYAIKVWTEIDPYKLNTFRKNNLNFQIIYPNNLVITK